MKHCMGDMYLTYCLVYLDDFIIYSKTYEELLERLEAVVTKLREAALKLETFLCQLFPKSIKYIRHLVSESGIITDQAAFKHAQCWYFTAYWATYLTIGNDKTAALNILRDNNG